MSGYGPEESHREPVLEALDAIDTRLAERAGDARAQLWARVYAAEFELYRRRDAAPPETIVYVRSEGTLRETTALACAQRRALETADAAVRDFDEHYLGGKR